MPNRIIRDAARTSPSLCALSDLAERTFWRAITVLDDHGRYHGDLSALMAACFPVGAVGLTQRRFQAAAAELQREDLLRFYEVGDRKYVYSPTWTKYQRLRAGSSKFPEPQQNQQVLQSAAGCREPRQMSPGNGDGIGDAVGDGIGVGHTRSPMARGGVSGFDDFWNAFPKKRAKGDALKAWKALKPDAPLLARILQALESQRESPDWQKAQGRYIPYPATWLRAQRWEDVLDAGRDGDELPRLEV